MTPPFVVGIFDATGNVVTASTAPVTLTLYQNPAGGTLSCGPLTCTQEAACPPGEL